MNAPARNSKPTGVKTMTEHARRQRDQFEADLMWLMNDGRGRRIAWWLLEQCHVYATSFRTSAEMPFLEGERNIGLKLINEIRMVCPEQNLAMEQDAIARRKRDDEILEATHKNNEGDSDG